MIQLWGSEETKLLPDDVCEHPSPLSRLVVSEEIPDGFKRVVQMAGAYKCSKPNRDGSSHGICSVRMWFVLVGPEGAVQWLLSTGWYTRTTLPLTGILAERPKPEAWDIGYHAREPEYADQHGTEGCEFLGGATCYYDGSGLNAVKFIPDFITHPGAIWEGLQKYYDSRFGRNA